MWKIDRLKASLQKPASEPQDKQPAAEPIVKKQIKDIDRKIALDEERAKEKTKKEDAKHDREKHVRKLIAAETVSRGSETNAEDRSRKDALQKLSKHNEQSGPKPPGKANRTDAKQRPSFVIPKLKKTAETTPVSSSLSSDTWSDMRKRGAELEKNRLKQTPPNSTGMRRIPKIVPKGGLCGKEDVGMLDKIEQHPGFLRWQQAQKNTPKTEDRRSSTAVKSGDDRSPMKQSVTSPVQQIYSVTDSRLSRPPMPLVSEMSRPPTSTETRPSQPPVPLFSETSHPRTPTETRPSQLPMPLVPETSHLPASTETLSSALPPTATKSLLPTPEKIESIPSLLSLPSSARKKVLLPTPDTPRSSTAAAPIPVLVRRGATSHSHGQFSSSPTNDEDDFVPDEAAGHPG